MLASKENQNIFSTESVPEGFVLIDPDHLKLFHIDSLYNHWLKRQSKGLTPFVILNAAHPVAKKKISEKANGKRKAEYVDVDSERSEGEGRSEQSGAEDEEPRGDDLSNQGEEEEEEKDKPTPSEKFGPPVRRGRKAEIPTDQGGPSGKNLFDKAKKGKAPKAIARLNSEAKDFVDKVSF